MMKIEIWSDIMCPFCYIGKRNLEAALAQFTHTKDVEVIWKSYQLDPSIPEDVNETYVGYLAKRRNVSEGQANEMMVSVTEAAKKVGLEYHFDKTIMTSSFKAHLLIQYAKTKGKGAEMEERLFKAFFTEGKNTSDIPTLTQLGKEIGLDQNDLAKAFTDEFFSDKVKEDFNEAIQIGVKGVPFFLLNRKYAVSGAQPAQVFLETIEKAYHEWSAKNKNTNFEVSEGQSCTIDGQCD